MSDYISRDEIFSVWRSMPRPASISSLTDAINRTPAANVEPVRHGRWEETDWVEPDGHGFGAIRTPNAGLRCSQCACVFKKELLWKRNWCPNCGARMDGESE